MCHEFVKVEQKKAPADAGASDFIVIVAVI